MDEPIVAKAAPMAVEVEAGKKYFWCSCGRSASQPFCDGAHKNTAFTPVEYQAAEDTTVYFCCCKHTAAAPMCDGAHKNI